MYPPDPEVTPEMIEAGTKAYNRFEVAGLTSELLTAIYLCMNYCKPLDSTELVVTGLSVEFGCDCSPEAVLKAGAQIYREHKAMAKELDEIEKVKHHV